jgi:hypothetical protein
VDAAMTPPILLPLFQSLACICSRAAGDEELSIRLGDRQDSVMKKMKLDGSLTITTTTVHQASGVKQDEIGWVTDSNNSSLQIVS